MSDWSCGSCGQSSPGGTRFCGHCGASAAQATAPVATWSCRDCGTTNPETNAFCGGCGARMQAARTEELRLVTALFADISGFTTLADSLDVESLHEVITPLVRGLTQIAERYEGFIEKFAGDALLVLYGAPVTHEDDAQRALLAALDMHGELPRLLSEIGPHAAHLTIHIGVNTGRVIGRQVGSEQQSDYAVLGDSVILAQRLESAAPAGETYVGPTTYELCKDEFELESVGELTLKGKLKPVHAYRLAGRRAAAAVQRPLVGREREVAAVLAGLAGPVTVLRGEPGAGKSRLLAEVRTRWDGRWLAARCLSYGASLAYWPLADLLRQELGVGTEHRPEAVAAALGDRLPAEALPAARRLLGLVSGGDPETARREVHDGLAAWLRTCAAEQSLVLVLEDLHWADRSTVEVLAELVRVGEVPVSLLLVTRDEGRSLAQEVAGDRDQHVVSLEPLDPAAVAALAGAVLDGRAGPGLVELLHARTGGNALHVVELTRALTETAALVTTIDGHDLRPGWDEASVPATLERVYATRLDALTPPAAAVLQLAAVVGRTARESLLRAVDDSGQADAALPQLLAAGMLERTTDVGEAALTFSHALLQDVVYARMLRKRRRELHRRVADVARELYGEADDTIGLLARHLYLADAGPDAVEPLLRAGRRAAQLYANDEAATHLQRALEVIEAVGAPTGGGLLLELAGIHQLRGAYDDALRLYERACDVTGEPAAWRGRAAVLRCRGEYDRALDVFVDALKHVDPKGPGAAGLWLEGGLVLAGQGRAADAISTLLTGLRLVGTHDETERGRLLTRLAHVRTTIGDLERAAEDASAAIALQEKSQAAHDLVRALRVSGVIQLQRGDRARAEAELLRARQVALQVQALEEAAASVLNLGLISLEDDRPEEAAELFLEALAMFERIGNAPGRAHAMGNVADALARAGQADAAAVWCGRTLALTEQTGHRLVHADVLKTLALTELLQGRPSHAALTAERAAAELHELDAVHEAVEALELAARAHDAAGEDSLARGARVQAERLRDAQPL